ncbi:antifungal protein ginkbilobin-like protein [Eucalyptus grandis]|uniref:antifungal protein ginkbilobin-like protein n=1 Tax=Eucalyptus grandis TaxID=71139 RepID=UPI0008A0F535|nr:antifungal protein ginkbilobin-like protein [Eucalyptus grandis]
MTAWQTVSITILLLFSVLDTAQSGPDVSLVYKICSADEFSIYDTYAGSVAEVLNRLMDKTSSSGFNLYITSNPSFSNLCYGHGACDGALSHSDCDSCLKSATNLIIDQCEYHVGVQFQLEDCRIRYENYRFFEG